MQLLWASLLLAVCGAASLPNYGKICSRNEPELDKCLLTFLKRILPTTIKDGVPELEIPPLDPFDVPDMLFEYAEPPVDARLLVRGVRAHGAAGFELRDLRAVLDDAGDFRMHVESRLPEVLVEGEYKSQGTVGDYFKIDTKGYFNVSMSDIDITWKLEGKHFQKEDGKDYVKITHFEVEPVVGDLQFYATNLFPGDPALSRLAVEFANQNWPILYEGMKPYASSTWDKEGRAFFNKIFLKVPFDELFPKE